MDSENRVLIVDDEPNVRLMLRTALESVGYQVIEAEEGLRALDRLREVSFDVILLDLLMPKMDGMALLRRLREAKNRTPVVILTAHGSIPEAVSAMKLGAIDFLTKPITPDALRRVVAEVIERHRSDLAPRAVNDNMTPAAAVVPTDHSRQIALDLGSAKRALNLGDFGEAEVLLRAVIELDPKKADAHLLLDKLLTLKAQEEHEPFRILRNWFPSGGRAQGKN